MSRPPAPPPVLTLSREEMRARALAFAKRWAGPHREKSEAQTFLNEFFEVFGRDRRNVDARFEHPVEREGRGAGSVDLFWRGKFVVEMKSTGEDLSAQKGGAAKQGFDYIEHLAPDERPRWVLVSDFAHFVLYDLGEEVHDYLSGLASARKTSPVLAAQFTLADLPDKLRHFAFIRDEEQALFTTQPEVNLKAVTLLANFHDSLKNSGYTGRDLERFLVRVLFCLFAEDTEIFAWNCFTRYVENSKKDGSDLGGRLVHLFETLDKPVASRYTSISKELAEFPYVNGGLFADRLPIADLTEADRAALIACCRFDWSRISPAIFGSLFQGVMEPVERRAKGAHYTSEENIRRVIDPLFLDDLKAEFARLSVGVGKKKALEQFHDRLAALRFLDPACGCGNFLVVAYRELRALELEVLHGIYGKQLALGLDIADIVRLNVDQFYGIELEEFPALIAETALWLTDHQANVAVSKAFGRLFVRIPLKKSPTIVPGNALRLDWQKILPAKKCGFVFGNPPFIGKHLLSVGQQADMAAVWGDVKGAGLLDYVTAWYLTAARYVQGTRIRCAFVSTNSITQGEQPGVMWPELFQSYHLKIHFAHRTFVWHNEASGKAHVHVVIVGFGAFDAPRKRLYDYDANGKQSVESGDANLSPYLIVGSDVALPSRTSPICGVPPVIYGNKPADGGSLIIEEEDRAAFVRENPAAKPYVRPMVSADEFLHGQQRYCLWLVDAPPAIITDVKGVTERVERVRAFRLASPKAPTREAAKRSSLFAEIRQPKRGYVLIPRHTSETRDYIPFGYFTARTIVHDSCTAIPDAEPFHFGVLSSLMHVAWVRQICGRIKSDFRYSNRIVYNNYPWPAPTPAQRAAVGKASQAVLDARAPWLDSGSSLAQLYDPRAMPANLLKAHQALDRAVDKCYRAAIFTSDRERVEFLFKLYEALSAPLAPAAKPARRPRTAKPVRPAVAPETVRYLNLDELEEQAGEAALIHHSIVAEDPPPKN